MATDTKLTILTDLVIVLYAEYLLSQYPDTQDRAYHVAESKRLLRNK